jgi:2-iminobutanoate/2-iminopropanoate deaminase
VKSVLTERAPAPVGPYSQAIVHGGVVYVSGQIPLDPATGKVVEGSIEAQTERVLQSLREVLEAAGSGLDAVIRTTIYLTDLSLFARVNAVYASHMRATDPPARATVGVAALPLGVGVEIDAIAAIED